MARGGRELWRKCAKIGRKVRLDSHAPARRIPENIENASQISKLGLNPTEAAIDIEGTGRLSKVVQPQVYSKRAGSKRGKALWKNCAKVVKIFRHPSAPARQCQEKVDRDSRSSEAVRECAEVAIDIQDTETFIKLFLQKDDFGQVEDATIGSQHYVISEDDATREGTHTGRMVARINSVLTKISEPVVNLGRRIAVALASIPRVDIGSLRDEAWSAICYSLVLGIKGISNVGRIISHYLTSFSLR